MTWDFQQPTCEEKMQQWVLNATNTCILQQDQQMKCSRPKLIGFRIFGLCKPQIDWQNDNGQSGPQKTRWLVGTSGFGQKKRYLRYSLKLIQVPTLMINHWILDLSYFCTKPPKWVRSIVFRCTGAMKFTLVHVTSNPNRSHSLFLLHLVTWPSKDLTDFLT